MPTSLPVGARSAGVRRIIVSVAALPAALPLYTDALRLTLRRQHGDLAELDTADGLELLLHQRPVDRGDAAVAIGFLVADLDAVVARWTALGGLVVDRPAAQPWGERMAVVRDVDGHIVCISEAPPASTG